MLIGELGAVGLGIPFLADYSRFGSHNQKGSFPNISHNLGPNLNKPSSTDIAASMGHMLLPEVGWELFTEASSR